MRFCWFFAVIFSSIVLLSISASASDLTVKVVDPQSAVVSGAQVELFAENSTHPVSIQTTSAQGVARFRDVPSAATRVHVLAPGFAEHWQSVAGTGAGSVTVALELAVATETVVVTATRTPTPSDESGAAIATLSGGELHHAPRGGK